MTLLITDETHAGSPEPALNAVELQTTDAYWRACNYLCAGMIYLHDNPLLREPLRPEHIKNRLLDAGLLRNRCNECGLSEWRGKPISIR